MIRLSKYALINGAIILFINIVIQIVVYYNAPQFFGEMYFSLLLMGLNLLMYIISTLYLRKLNGGFWSFKYALKYIFITALTANTLGLVFSSLFYTYVEPNAYQKIIGIVKASTIKNYKDFGYNDAQIYDMMKGLEQQFKSQYNPSVTDFFKTLAVSILVAFVLSLIFAAIFKRENKALNVSEASE